MHVGIEQLIQQSLTTLQQEKQLPQLHEPVSIQLTRPKQTDHGDFACNIALVLAKQTQQTPRVIAEMIVKALPASDVIVRVDIAGPGFINFFLRQDVHRNVISTVLNEQEMYGRVEKSVGKRILVEFVSANPTGPLHVGHGRSVAYGSALCNVLEAAGNHVDREYYVNDAGRQMDILALSVWFRYLNLLDEKVSLPENAYQGDYVIDIAKQLKVEVGNQLHRTVDEIFLVVNDQSENDLEKTMDQLIARAKTLLGPEYYRQLFDAGLQSVLYDIEDDLSQFGLRYQNWFSERSLIESNKEHEVLERLKHSKHVYEQDGALWFRSTQFGDEKDRVLLRENGQPTYFLTDVAYHVNKVERGYDQLINIFGADHHGYIPRIRGSLAALGYDANVLKILLVQFAVLYRGEERIQMSTRSGSFVTLRELYEEVGKDAARLFYVMRKAEQHMDFDLELAKAHSNENPVYYIQYAHARICSVFRQLAEKNGAHDLQEGQRHIALLTESHEEKLFVQLARYPEMVQKAAESFAPHLIAHYLHELAHDMHAYYNAHLFLVEDLNLRHARLNLIVAVRQVLANGLTVLGADAPQHM